jgi:hypothetical protein
MPIAPKFPFHKVTCTSCGWSHISVQRSDVIFGPSVCGKCGCADLTHSEPSLVEATLALPMESARYALLGKLH